MNLRVAGAQIAASSDVIQNCMAIERAVDFAAGEKADILLTPEGSLSGYHSHFSQVEVAKATKEIVSMAAANRVGLALGTCYYEDDGLCYNQLRFYGQDGSFLGAHCKTLLCGRPEDLTAGEINDYAVAPLRTFVFQGVTVGGLICNDLWANPEWTPGDDTHLTRQLAAMGAKIVFHAVNSGSAEGPYASAVKGFHESNLRIRANAGHLWIATVNCCYADGPCSCASGVVTPEGEWACATPLTGERFYAFDCSIDD